MKIGIISDTHDVLSHIEKAVSIFNREQVDLVIHAGDFVSPFTARPFKKLQSKMKAVFGNNDGDKLLLRKMFQDIADIYDYAHQFEFDGKKILITHYNTMIDCLQQSDSLDYIIYGHTHNKQIIEGRPLIINPGTASGYLAEKPTIALLDSQSSQVKIIDL